MLSPPERFKAAEDLSVEELLEHRRTGELPETAEYVEYVDTVHRATGIETGRPAGNRELEEMSPDDHFNQIRRRA